MVAYTQNELMSITDFTKSISKVLSQINDGSLEKVGILKNNKLEAVVMSAQEYNRLKSMKEHLKAKEDKS